MPRGGRRHCQVRFDRCFHERLRPTTGRADRPRCRHGITIVRKLIRFEFRFQQGVVLIEVGRRHVRVRCGVGRHLVLFDDCFDRLRIDRTAFVQQPTDCCFDCRFAFCCGQVKDSQVFAARPGWQTLAKFVVGHAKPDTGEQVVMPLVILEGSRLADEARNNVPVVDAMLVLAVQSWKAFRAALSVPHFKMLGEDADRHFFADQSARHAVGVVLDANRARLANQ